MANRIEFFTYRKFGAQDDRLLARAYADGAESDMKRVIAEVEGLRVTVEGDFLDEDGGIDAELIQVTNTDSLRDRDVLHHNGRKFRINITEVTD